MPKHSLDLAFQALADPTRRAVLHRLSRGPAAMTELSRPFAMAPPSFLQHLGILERCGLVRSAKRGRVRTYRLESRRLRTAEAWISKQRAAWETRLNQLDAYLKEMI